MDALELLSSKLTHYEYGDARGIAMYDNLPYKRDTDFIGAVKPTLYSGHVIKYYACINKDDAFVINNHDDEINEILRQISIVETSRVAKKASLSGDIDSSESIEDKQIQTLLEDQTASDKEKTDSLSQPEEPESDSYKGESLDDIDDW